MEKLHYQGITFFGKYNLIHQFLSKGNALCLRVLNDLFYLTLLDGFDSYILSSFSSL